MAARPLPLDVRLMTLTTSALGWALVAMVLAGLGLWAVRHPVWTVAAIEVHGDLTHQNTVTFRAHMGTRLRGSFLTLDLAEVQKVFESVPWVRKAVVQREFPNRIKVTLEEHQAVAWWGNSGDSQLVNRQGEVFEASAEDDDTDKLPELAGPEGQAPRVKALHAQLSPVFTPLGTALQRLELTAQGGWRAGLDNGARLELGRGEPDELMARVTRFAQTLTQVTQQHGRRLEAADLRYPSAYAVRLHGVTTGELPKPVRLVKPAKPAPAANAANAARR